MSEVKLREPLVHAKDLTAEICGAIRAHSVAVIPDATVYTTDRAVNASHKGFLGARGNSEVEAGHTFSLARLVEALHCDLSELHVSMNSIRIYGQIPATGALHYHGYSRKHKEVLGRVNQVILFVVNSIGTYEIERTLSVSEDRATPLPDGRPGTALIYQDKGRLVLRPLCVGDMVVLPCGIAHTFAAGKDIWASYSVTEIATDPKVMYQTHWFEEEGQGLDVQTWLRASLEDEARRKETTGIELTLADIQGAMPYVSS